MPLAPGTQLGPYEISVPLGAGGMGEVYRARDTRLGRNVAIKILPAEFSWDPVRKQRFEREAKTISSLNHPHICVLYDVGSQDGVDYLVMECVEGETLATRLEKGPLPLEEVLKFGTQVADALDRAHRSGIVHRDLKPSNIMLTASGAKLLDFGLAKLLRPADMEATIEDLVQTRGPVGTLPYMAPEQVLGREVDIRTDVYALGMVLYEMATCKRPFREDLATHLTDDILHQLPLAPGHFRPDIPGPFEEISLKCLEKAPGNRYQSAREVEAALEMLATNSASVRAVQAWYGVAAVVLAVVLMGSALFGLNIGRWHMRLFNAARSPQVESLAVLPLLNLSGDPQQDYIADGITEGVINKLSEIPDLKVMSRSSVFRFKGKATDAQAAGRDLKVQAVLTGRITRQADELAISAELVYVSDGSQIWGRQFRYPISDLPRAQDQLASAILEKLKLRLNSADETRLAKSATDNSEAYQLYLQGRYHWSQRTPAGIKKSIEFFQQATEKDPNFALAYVGLADAYNMGNNIGVFTSRESAPEAKAAVTKALVLDPRLGEAHAILGQVKSHYDFDLPGAQREFLKAIELNPNYANAHLYYAGGYLTPMGRHAEAIAEMKKALELDPLSSALNNYMGMTYLLAGDYQKSVQQLQHTIELDPTFPLAHVFLASALTETGKYEQAIEETQRGALLSGASPERASAVTAEFLTAFRSGGPNGYWKKNLQATLWEQEHGATRTLELASAYARVGDKEKSLEWLEKAYEERIGDITLVNSYPDYKSLRKDPRFADLLRRIGLPH